VRYDLQVQTIVGVAAHVYEFLVEGVGVDLVSQLAGEAEEGGCELVALGARRVSLGCSV
jgi:hypothetical protein